jgi:hypothetical protein
MNEWDLRAALKQNALSLANQIQPRIDARTYVDTGALQSAMTYDLDSDPDTNLLVKFYADPGPQEAQWGRVYLPYQEGPPLGLSTYTNPPRQMLYGVGTEDLGIIQTWAEETLQNKVNSLGGTP